MAGRYGGTMPKKRGKRQEAKGKGKQVPAMKFLQMVGEGTLWALKQVDKATAPPTKQKDKATSGGANESPPGNRDPVLP